MAAGDQLRELPDHTLTLFGLVLLALEREQVPAQEDPAAQMALEGAQDRVLVTGQFGRDVVGQLDPGLHALRKEDGPVAGLTC